VWRVWRLIAIHTGFWTGKLLEDLGKNDIKMYLYEIGRGGGGVIGCSGYNSDKWNYRVNAVMNLQFS